MRGGRILARLLDRFEYGEHVGACRVCGSIRDGCEPDAARYRCDECGRYAVDGVELWMLDTRMRPPE